MQISKNVPIGTKTTMRIGGEALYYGELESKEDCEEAVQFASEKDLPLILLGGGSNMVFADGTVNALVVRIKANSTKVDDTTVTVHAGKNLPMLINELAEQGLDLSALTGIPGSVGGAIIGNAGQGPSGIWINAFVVSVVAHTSHGWKDFSVHDCSFAYRESIFKNEEKGSIIWEVTLEVPKKDPKEIQHEIENLLQKRIETQPHVKTAGSCFKAVQNVPAWKLIDAVGLRGTRVGDVSVSEKHANFLINDGKGTFKDAVALIQQIEESVDQPLEVEMRFVNENGEMAF